MAASAASAQRLERTIDLSALGWGHLEEPVDIDTDGNPATNEWLLVRLPQSFSDVNVVLTEYQVVAERPSGLCVSGWFSVSAKPFGTKVRVIQRGGISKLQVFEGAWFGIRPVSIWSLDTPPC